MKQFQIPKHTFIASVQIPGEGQPTRLSFFLGESAQDHGGPERPSDLLNGAQTFLPAMDERGRVAILNLELVASVTITTDEEVAPGSGFLRDITTTRAPVTVVLDDGTRLTGRFEYDLPDTHRRLQDYLNLDARFFMLVEDHSIRFINRRRVASVRPLETVEEGCPR